MCAIPIRLFGAFLLLATAPSLRAAEEKFSEEDYLENSASIIAAQDFCGFVVDEAAVKAYVAARLPDMAWELYAAKINGTRRILPRFTDEMKERNCARWRVMARSAGWTR